MFFFPALVLGLSSTLMAGAVSQWQPLAAGADLRILVVKAQGSAGDSRITVVRFDPDLWQLEFAGISRTGEPAGQTAREWCERRKLAAAINAGMYDTDYSTHVGYLRSREHLNNGRVNGYQSIAAFDPVGGGGVAPFRLFDLDEPGVTMRGIRKDYASAVQNLRLIKRPGANKWMPQDKKWSEAALGEDDAGRILFIFSPSPLSMRELNKALLAGGIGLVAAQHLEGGSEAQLYVHVGETELELFGSHDGSVEGDDTDAGAYPIPNVLGVRQRSSASGKKSAR
jgi:hypothetical protein